MKDRKRKKTGEREKQKWAIKEIKVQTSPQKNERYMDRPDYFTTSRSKAKHQSRFTRGVTVFNR
jgi:hypothetical protein